tara:strand:- start:1195 stop:1476 length:282 start_codon:yes stop_codon:yes gene_type:complete
LNRDDKIQILCLKYCENNITQKEKKELVDLCGMSHLMKPEKPFSKNSGVHHFIGWIRQVAFFDHRVNDIDMGKTFLNILNKEEKNPFLLLRGY